MHARADVRVYLDRHGHGALLAYRRIHDRYLVVQLVDGVMCVELVVFSRVLDLCPVHSVHVPCALPLTSRPLLQEVLRAWCAAIRRALEADGLVCEEVGGRP
jgi:hypothetical protein